VLDAKILDAQDLAVVKRKAWEIRARYARLVGPEHLQQYLASQPPDDNGPEADLRADLAMLLSAFHRTYSTTLLKEKLRKRVSKRLSGIAAVVCGLGLISAYWVWNRQVSHSGPVLGAPADLPLFFTILVVIVFGVAGSYVSAQQRLQAPDAGDPVIGALGLWHFHSAAQMAMVTGGVFAILLWLLMYGGLIEGDLFPEFGSDAIPEGAKDWAKLLIWSFIAGFAERLVPSALDRLASTADKVVVAPPPSGGAVDQKKQPEAPGESKEPGDALDALIQEFGAPPGPPKPEDSANKGQFDGKSEDGFFKLEATVLAGQSATSSRRIDVKVSKVGSVPGVKVTFRLSPRFRKHTVEVPMVNDAASITFASFYPFVVGAKIEPGNNKLEIDLAESWK
jgi:hypothetical protein